MAYVKPNIKYPKRFRRGVQYKKLAKRDRNGYKYEMLVTASIQTAILGFLVRTKWFTLTRDGVLIIYPGYRWDGPSGPTFDTETFMRGSLFHDAFWQMIREKLLPEGVRSASNLVMRAVCREDGMSRFRAWYVYHSVDKLGGRWA